MRFSTSFFVSAFAAIASAQNMFTMATLPTSIAVGTTFNITWQATTPGTISLLLVQAASPGSTLVHEISTIAANISNTGSFAWIPSSQTPKGSGYAIEIIDDANPYITNYSGQFAIDSSTSPSSAAPSSTGALSSGITASPTMSSSNSSTTGSASGASKTGGSSSSGGPTTLSTMTSSSSNSPTSSSSSPSTTAKIAGAAVESARSGLGLLAALGVAVLFL